MSRLIDADALIENIRKRHYIDKALCEIFETIIDEQPTAYDIEKVVAELEEKQKKYIKAFNEVVDATEIIVYSNIVNAYGRAIEIVKAGGVK